MNPSRSPSCTPLGTGIVSVVDEFTDALLALIYTPALGDPEGPALLGGDTLTEPGDYAYYCSLHGTATKGMTGAIRVLE